MCRCLIAGIFLSLSLFVAAPVHAQLRISDDRELKEIDLTGWDCLDQPGGSAKTPDAVERNRGKNRSTVELTGPAALDLDSAGFLKLIGAFDAQTKNKRRKDLNAAETAQVAALEKQVVSFTAYLVLAYAGPPETTNCASVDFHDWHLELFEEPFDHAPGIGDPTPIIGEITPRTQNALFRSGVRLLDLAAFMRRPDFSIEATGHKARKIRLTGFLLWDDEHNGEADVGTIIQSVGENKFHHPWRATAWELHPVLKIEALEETTTR